MSTQTATPPIAKPVVEFKNVDIIFGNKTAEAMKLLDAGMSRADILEKTGSVLGAAGSSTFHNN